MEYYTKQLDNLIDEFDKIISTENIISKCLHLEEYTMQSAICENCANVINKIKNAKDDYKNIYDIKSIFLELSGIILRKYDGYNSKVNMCKNINIKAKILYNEISNDKKSNIELINRNYYLEEENKKLEEELNEIKSRDYDIKNCNKT